VRTPSEDPGTDKGIPRAQATMRSVTLVRSQDEPGFWERLGWHNYGDPWREQRYWGD
jgi:DMSO/TMAO reductase YedYZ molybdopterin-dependent catalytic subunit